MSKTGIIIQREYSTRVKKKSFIIMTILGPILMAGLFIAPAWMATLEDNEVKNIAVVDSSYLFRFALPETETIHFDYLNKTSLKDAEKSLNDSNYYAVLFIPSNILAGKRVELSSVKQPSIAVKMHIKNCISREIETLKLAKNNIDPYLLESIKTDINISTIKLEADGSKVKTSTEINMIVGLVSAILIYMFIFMYGAQIMRGVIEEKTNRIIEVIVSSVRPFELMMGKIIGVALVGLTQFVLWIILTFAIVTAAKGILMPDKELNMQMVQMNSIMNTPGTNNAVSADPTMVMPGESEIELAFQAIDSINYGTMLLSFLFFFLGGYLLYGALFAAIGSAVDNDADTQQFMLPVTIPLILGIVAIQGVITNPEGPLAFWFSMIPFTSPIVMMARIAFNPPLYEVIISGVILIITFIACTWMAAKIYRTGILMYGKKISYRELYKWLRYRNY
jgi:ABC-2 type transport system permease protein